MGTENNTEIMKVFILAAALAAASAAPAPQGYASPASPDLAEPALYAFQYGVSDDYSGANFAQEEQRDGYSTSGSYRVALPDGRTQVVNYRTDGDSGNIQDVTYEGVPSYGPAAVVGHGPLVHHAPVIHHAPLIAHHAPLIAHHAPLLAHAPLVAHHGAVLGGYRGAGQISHQSVSKPYQGEHRSTTQSKAFGAAIASVADSPNRLHGARGLVAHGFGHGAVFHG